MVVKSKLSTLALMALPATGKFTHPVGFAGGVCSCRFDPEVVFDNSAAVPLRPFACFISCSASNPKLLLAAFGTTVLLPKLVSASPHFVLYVVCVFCHDTSIYQLPAGLDERSFSCEPRSAKQR